MGKRTAMITIFVVIVEGRSPQQKQRRPTRIVSNPSDFSRDIVAFVIPFPSYAIRQN